MGVDARVDYVICAQTSQSMEDLIQAWGRSGRSGKDAHCYLLYNAKDKNTCDFLIRASTKNSERLRIKLNKLHSFHSFCSSNTCIRKGILEYFGEQFDNTNCGGCSVCLKKLTK
jgi:ATP-dependent DNA helicase RecQ